MERGGPVCVGRVATPGRVRGEFGLKRRIVENQQGRVGR
jgi:hypothetical protein